jgi:hypothetical protein
MNLNLGLGEEIGLSHISLFPWFLKLIYYKS